MKRPGPSNWKVEPKNWASGYDNLSRSQQIL
jgi:hypothetical protein